MIIFDLDGTLADCEHRRHFVDGTKHYCKDCATWLRLEPVDNMPCPSCGKSTANFKPDWKSFYAACDQDTPIRPVINIFRTLMMKFMPLENDIQIWSGRCESVRNKTIDWLNNHVFHEFPEPWIPYILQMRPINDSTPDDVLKERWLDEAIAEGKTIEMVFDDRKKVVRMWRRRGIFVFDCNQSGKEF